MHVRSGRAYSGMAEGWRPNLTQWGFRYLTRRPDEHERKIVGRHRNHLAQRKPVRRCFADEIVYVTDAPARVSHLEVHVKCGVRGRCMRAAPHEGAVEIKNSARLQQASRAGEEPEGGLPRR